MLLNNETQSIVLKFMEFSKVVKLIHRRRSARRVDAFSL